LRGANCGHMLQEVNCAGDGGGHDEKHAGTQKTNLGRAVEWVFRGGRRGAGQLIYGAAGAGLARDM